MNKTDLQDLYNIYTIEELSKMLGCSAPTIYARLKEYNIPLKGQKNKKHARTKLIIDED